MKALIITRISRNRLDLKKSLSRNILPDDQYRSIKRRTAIFPMAALCIISWAFANELTEISPGSVFTSPNGAYTAKAFGGGSLPATDRIAVIENRTGREIASVAVNPPLYSLIWTRDCKSVVTVSHIAGGTVAGVLHYSGGEWKQYSADPREGDKYSVIRQAMTQQGVELTYKIALVPKGGSPGSFYLYSFVFDPETTAHKDEKRESIDAATYAQLRLN